MYQKVAAGQEQHGSPWSSSDGRWPWRRWWRNSSFPWNWPETYGSTQLLFWQSITVMQVWRCQLLSQEIENKWRQRGCATIHTRFQKMCLDSDVLQLGIRNCGDIRNDRKQKNSTRAFRKAGVREYVLGRFGYLRNGNRKVRHSCVVKTCTDFVSGAKKRYASNVISYLFYCMSNWLNMSNNNLCKKKLKVVYLLFFFLG